VIRLLATLALLGGIPHAVASQSQLDALLQELKAERRSEQVHHQEREARFLLEQERRRQLLEQAQAIRQQAEDEAERLRADHQANEERLRALEAELSTSSGELTALFQWARQQAADTRARQAASPVAAAHGGEGQALEALAQGKRLPTIEQLEGLWLALLGEMNRAGRTNRTQATVIGPDGVESRRTVLRVGPFVALSQGRYLRFLPEAGRYMEPARQPSLRTLLGAARFEQATDGIQTLAVDPSQGTLLGLMGRTPTLRERIDQGGVIGYLILAAGAFALLLVAERFAVLGWLHLRMRAQSRREQPRGDNPLGRVQRVAQTHADASLEALDIHLDEAVTREANRLTRGLTTLGVVAAMAPLLGLLGTVTGMIETFQTMTLFGSGDPKLMSSGISQALVTTQLGLVVAVPVLLLHSFLKGRANRLIGELDGQVNLLLGNRA
jgi:biopolymer transport protein ExbB